MYYIIDMFNHLLMLSVIVFPMVSLSDMYCNWFLFDAPSSSTGIIITGRSDHLSKNVQSSVKFCLFSIIIFSNGEPERLKVIVSCRMLPV